MTAQLDTARRSSAHGDPLRAFARPAWVRVAPELLDDGRPTEALRAIEFAEDIRHRGYPHAGAIVAAGARPVASWPIEQRELWAVGTTVVEFDPAGVRVRVDAADEIERARRRETPGPRARDADESSRRT